MDNNHDIVILPTFDVVVTDVIVTHSAKGDYGKDNIFLYTR